MFKAVALLLGVVLFVGCDDGAQPTQCVPGAASPCACADGAEGVQVCSGAGAFEACVCAETDARVPDATRPDVGQPDMAVDATLVDAVVDSGPDAMLAADQGPAPECVADGDCAGGQVCTNAHCVEPAVCAADEDCLDDRVCEAAACQAPCVSDDGCQGARVCAEGRCVESEVCLASEDCDPGRVCVAAQCQAPCGAAEACPGRQLCQGDGTCAEDPNGCHEDADCLGGRVCAGAVCAEPCVEDAQCAGDRACVAGLCPEASPCFGPDDCDEGRLCGADGACADRCGEANPCADGLTCAGTGLCVAHSGCADDAGCPGGQVCVATQCVARCVEDADCPGNRHCVVETGHCPEAAPCLAEADCDAGRRCEAFACVHSCLDDAACPGAQRCENARCVEPEACAGDGDCLPGRHCDLGGACADPCMGDGACGGAQICDAEGRCGEPAQCAADLDCVGGRRCDAEGRCYAPECEADAACAGAACVDGRCGLAPWGCDAARPCAAGLSCAPAGVCARAEACAVDGDCPASSAGCDRDGRCPACRVAADCAATDDCRDGLCVPSRRACAGDGDCPGARRCVDEACVPGACEDDLRGASEPPEGLGLRTHGGLIACDGAVDRFALPRMADGFTVWVRTPTDGAPIFATVDDLADGSVVASATSVFGAARLHVAPGAPRDLRLRVETMPGAVVPYAIQVLAGVACAPDALEGALGNDAPERATAVGAGVHGLRICPDDVDWFSVDLPAGARLQADVAEAGAQVLVFNPARVEQPAGPVQTQTPGRYLIRVAAAPGATLEATLQIAVQASAEAAGLACAAVPALVPGVALPVGHAVGVSRLGVTCGGGADAVAGFVLAEPSRVSLRLDGAEPAFTGAVAIRGVCDSGASERACAGGGRALRDVLLPAGAWTAVAAVPEAGPARLTLEVATRCEADAACGAEARCTAGVCAARCADDAACGGAQICEAGRCVAPEICAEDADCPGLTVCELGACVAFECGDNGDCAEGVCVDRQCMAQAPVACAEHGACDGLICAPLGACAPDGPCAVDADCGPGAPWCEPGLGACVRCRADEDCVGRAFCEGGRCEPVHACADDAECPGTRLCSRAGSCEPVACAGDGFDPLGDPPVLAVRTYGQLLLCDGDTDTYGFAVPEGTPLQVVVRHDAAVGDLRLAVADPLLEAPIAVDGAIGLEVIEVPAGPARTVEVTVAGAPGVSVPYALSAQLLAVGTCVRDTLEGPLGNDDAAHATLIEPGDHALTLCADQDWLRLPVKPGTRVVARTDRPVALRLLPVSGAPVVGVPAGAGVEAALAASESPVRIELSAADLGPVALSLVAEAAPNAAEMACAVAPALEPGVALPLQRGLPAVRRVALGCGQGRADDYVARFHLDAPARVTLQLAGSPIGAAFALRSACADAASEPVCVERRLEDMPLEAGDWWVWIQTGPFLGPPALTLTVH